MDQYESDADRFARIKAHGPTRRNDLDFLWDIECGMIDDAQIRTWERYAKLKQQQERDPWSVDQLAQRFDRISTRGVQSLADMWWMWAAQPENAAKSNAVLRNAFDAQHWWIDEPAIYAPPARVVSE